MDILLENQAFCESPRWRDGWLYYSDFYDQCVWKVNLLGQKVLITKLDDQPSGLGWLPDKSLLVVSMRKRKIVRICQHGNQSTYADLSNLTKFNCNDMVVVRDIEFFSMCEHHMIPFFGRAHVGYIPNGKVIGLSKVPRIVDMFSRRLQVQERLTNQIANTLKDKLDPTGVAVVMEGRHMCMQMRGVEKQNSFTTTSAMLGQFRKSNETRAEFLSFIGK